ncbi:GAF and ANTAR domain-containing protein [Blastococcus haudaquaticus]|uniref:Two-component response regulator, AmiR/NasT family, consists of REC and RNA-binding antiterminator (ANTAR) domains n=1 Tax=Blastococcus haudaquaticus TaxID=1938745 RepID=A0A286GTE1_9ACTN|nr:GAF and ANTAR domain-containing protein [Blastococcus haudaquaticus]SOD98466.1 Two-component response regulator, AmiR/NasT family, consists of REC and RNA-binding antiterminator (ANTAR) domains [Blastococcus haudaquaticus]
MIPPDDDAVAVQPAFDELGRLSFAEHSLESLLQRVTALAAGVLPGEPVISLTILTDRGPSTVASSGELALRLDEEQYRLDSGPCLAAASTGQTSEIVDTRAPSDWPDFAPHAAAAGCGSVISFPLPVREKVAGALNVYARRFTVSDRRTRALVSRFADYAVVPVSNMYLYESAVERADHLATALDSRAVIDQAKGMLMERFTLTPDQAFRALTRVSMQTNTKVRDIAERFVATGDVPGLPTRHGVAGTGAVADGC